MNSKPNTMQDVVNNSNYFMAEKTSFEKAFPELNSIQIEYTEFGIGAKDSYGVDETNVNFEKTISDKRIISEYINCSNRACHNGGFCVGEKIREMVAIKKTTDIATLRCVGSEGSQRKKGGFKKCYNKIICKITMVYNT